MSRFVWLGLLATVIMAVACFYPWVIIPSKNIIISGVGSGETAFGKPGYLNFIFGALYVVFVIIPKEWARKVAMFAAGFNIGWAVRNFLLISTCYGGICPDRQPALYLVLVFSILMFVFLMFVKTEVKQAEEDE